MIRIFTKRFLELSSPDQRAVIASVMSDLESCIRRHRDPADNRKVEQQIKRIQKRAHQHGIEV